MQKLNIHNLSKDLVIAARYNNINLVKILLDTGADVNFRDDWPLHAASSYGYLEVVKLLLDQGAGIHSRDDGALRLSSINSHYDVVKLLLDRGADPEKVDLRKVDDWGIKQLILEAKSKLV